MKRIQPNSCAQRMVQCIVMIAVFTIYGTSAAAQTDTRREAKIRQAMKSIPTGTSAKQSLSPYFFVLNDDTNVDSFPLKSNTTCVDITGVIANVTQEQVYKNNGSTPLEAIYIFPASTRAAVHGMKMKVGKRTITAQIQKKENAKKIYETARREGRTASLLQQHRPNVFQMNVANILPGDEVKVTLSYTELIVPTDTVYQFVLPTVVGPRFVDNNGSTQETWTANPYLEAGLDSPFSVQIAVHMESSLPIEFVRSPSHKTAIDYISKTQVTVAPKDAARAGNKDFVLEYTLAGKKIESGVMTYEKEDEKYFMMLMEPPAIVRQRQITPREYIFVVDVSGSMNGFPLTVSKKLIGNILNNLRSEDRFNILFFAGGSNFLNERSLRATPKNIRRATQMLNEYSGGGGTRLKDALERVFAYPKATGMSRIVALATDGYISVERETFELTHNHRDDMTLFSFGIGSSVNRHLVDGIARSGGGHAFVALNQNEAQKKADAFRTYVNAPVLTDISVAAKGFEAYDMSPASVSDLFASRPIVIHGKFRGDRAGSIEVRGSTAQGFFQRSMAMKDAYVTQSPGLRYLWARNRIQTLSDEVDWKIASDGEAQITELGLAHSLLTNYTSFVAVDTVVRANGQKATTVKQPLPLPVGVSNAAVGLGATYASSGKRRMASSSHALRDAEPLSALLGGSSPGRPAAKASPAPSRADIIKEMRRITSKLTNRCTNRRPANAPATLRIRMTIGANGRISSAHVLNLPPGSEAYAACIVATLKRTVRLPANSKETTLTFPFAL